MENEIKHRNIIIPKRRKI